MESRKALFVFIFDQIKLMKSRLRNELDDFKTQIQRIFVYYCSFADKESYSLLKIQNYRRFILDLQLSQNSTLISQLDLVFYSHSQSTNLTLQGFSTVLGQIASLVFVDIEKEARLQKLLNIHLQPLYDQILKDTEFGQSMPFISASLFRQSSFVFLKKFQAGLFPLFKVYFNEQGQPGKEEQLKMFFKLSRELNLVPRVTSKQVSYLIFDYLRQRSSKSAFQSFFKSSLSQNPKSYVFNFVCFMEYLIIISHINQRTDEKEQLKLYRLLELIEVSSGCQQLSKKQKFKHFYLTEKQLEQSLQDKAPQILFNTHKSITSVDAQPRSVESPLKRRLVQYYEPLKKKFIQICAKKQVENNFYLSSSIAKRMIEKICPKLTGMSIELLIASVGRINFQNFIVLLDKSAQKVGLFPQTLYDQVLLFQTEGYNLNLILQNTKLSKTEETTCRQILRQAQSYIRSIFDYYQTQGNISLASYIKLMHELGVIPSIMTAVQATDIYRITTKKEHKMNLVQFQQSLLGAIVSIHFDFELQGAERLIYLFEKICESKKGEALMKKNVLMVREHPLHMLRLNFNTSYREIQKKLEFNTRSVMAESEKNESFDRGRVD